MAFPDSFLTKSKPCKVPPIPTYSLFLKHAMHFCFSLLHLLLPVPLPASQPPPSTQLILSSSRPNSNATSSTKPSPSSQLEAVVLLGTAVALCLYLLLGIYSLPASLLIEHHLCNPTLKQSSLDISVSSSMFI